jgi:hypothetical protein
MLQGLQSLVIEVDQLGLGIIGVVNALDGMLEVVLTESRRVVLAEIDGSVLIRPLVQIASLHDVLYILVPLGRCWVGGGSYSLSSSLVALCTVHVHFLVGLDSRGVHLLSGPLIMVLWLIAVI